MRFENMNKKSRDKERAGNPRGWDLGREVPSPLGGVGNPCSGVFRVKYDWKFFFCEIIKILSCCFKFYIIIVMVNCNLIFLVGKSNFSIICMKVFCHYSRFINHSEISWYYNIFSYKTFLLFYMIYRFQKY